MSVGTESAGPSRGSIKIESSLLRLAKRDDFQAIALMFRQFIPEDETVHFAEYLGVEGVWGIGTHSFGCLTDRRVAAIRVAAFGEVIYQDGYIDYVNSGVVYQPSRLVLYVVISLLSLLILASLSFLVAGIAVFQDRPMILEALGSLLVWLIAVPVMVRIYYRMFKCGLVFWVREGVSVYLFTNRGRLVRANRLYRNLTMLREHRLVAAPR